MLSPNLVAKFILTASLLAAGAFAHAAPCGPQDFRRIGTVVSDANARLIAGLKERIAEAKMSSVKLIEGDGRTILDIGYLQNDDTNLVKLIGVGVRSGAFDEFRCGSVVGPKAVTFVSRLVGSVSESSTLRFTGKLNPKELIETQIEEVEMGIRSRVTSTGAPEPFYWGEKEVAAFKTAFEKLRVREACQRLYGTTRLEDCGPMTFILTPGSGLYQYEKP